MFCFCSIKISYPTLVNIGIVNPFLCILKHSETEGFKQHIFIQFSVPGVSVVALSILVLLSSFCFVWLLLQNNFIKMITKMIMMMMIMMMMMIVIKLLFVILIIIIIQIPVTIINKL